MCAAADAVNARRPFPVSFIPFRLPTRARRIAANIANLPELLSDLALGVDHA